jgi:hypothetical protein
MGNKHSNGLCSDRNCDDCQYILENRYGGCCNRHEEDEDEDDPHEPVPSDDDLDDLIPRRHEPIESYIKELLATYPEDEIMRLTIEDPPTLESSNPTIASLGNLCINGITARRISTDNLERAMWRIISEKKKSIASTREAYVVLIEIGLAILRLPATTKPGDIENYGAPYAEIDTALYGLESAGLDAGTLMKGQWTAKVAQQVDARLDLMDDGDDGDDM